MTAPTLALPPPINRRGAVAWLREHLFGSRLDTLLTVVMAIVLGWVGLQLGGWVLGEARWGVVTTNLRLFLIGQYPVDQAWRILLSLASVATLLGASAAVLGSTVRTLAAGLVAGMLLLAALAAASGLGTAALALGSVALLPIATFVVAGRLRPRRRLLSIGWLASVPITLVLLAGLPGVGLAAVGTNLWGGLLLTVVLATSGIALSFPFGVLLALGRRSSMPAVRFIATAYIETIRGVPLISVIFMADLLLPLFLPGDVRIDRLARAVGGITLFSAAYVAENVRGGLQAIPSGQIEAAQALGLGTIATTRFIVLPQALRSVIPANVGLFISLLKDTTLVVIIGLLELLGIGRAVLAQSEWFGAQLEVYAFVALVFFLLCYALAQASYRLETALGVGTR